MRRAEGGEGLAGGGGEERGEREREREREGEETKTKKESNTRREKIRDHSRKWRLLNHRYDK